MTVVNTKTEPVMKTCSAGDNFHTLSDDEEKETAACDEIEKVLQGR